MTAAAEVSGDLWAAEPSGTEGQARIRARIAGLHCSLCTGTIEKALGRMSGVHQVAVSLTHEQALIDYETAVITPRRSWGRFVTSATTSTTRASCVPLRMRKQTWSARGSGCWVR